MAEPVVYVCNRVDEGPAYVPSLERRCELCAAAVWVDPLSLLTVRERLGTPKIQCTRCVAKIAPNAKPDYLGRKGF